MPVRRLPVRRFPYLFHKTSRRFRVYSQAVVSSAACSIPNRRHRYVSARVTIRSSGNTWLQCSDRHAMPCNAWPLLLGKQKHRQIQCTGCRSAELWGISSSSSLMAIAHSHTSNSYHTPHHLFTHHHQIQPHLQDPSHLHTLTPSHPSHPNSTICPPSPTPSSAAPAPADPPSSAYLPSASPTELSVTSTQAESRTAPFPTPKTRLKAQTSRLARRRERRMGIRERRRRVIVVLGVMVSERRMLRVCCVFVCVIWGEI